MKERKGGQVEGRELRRKAGVDGALRDRAWAEPQLPPPSATFSEGQPARAGMLTGRAGVMGGLTGLLWEVFCVEGSTIHHSF